MTQIYQFLNSLFIASILLQFCFYLANSAPSAIFKVYVDNQSNYDLPDGSEKNPFLNLNDALNFDSYTSQSEQIELYIYLASSRQPYLMKSITTRVYSDKVSSLGFFSWSGPCKESDGCIKPTIDFQNSTWFFEGNLSLTFSDLGIIYSSGSISMKEGALLVNNINFKNIAKGVRYFMSLSEMSNITFTGNTITLQYCANLVAMNSQNSVMTLENTTIVLKEADTSALLCTMALFDLSSNSLSSYSTLLTIRNFTIRSEYNDQLVQTSRILSASEFTSVEMEGIRFENQTLITNGLDYFSFKTISTLRINGLTVLNNDLDFIINSVFIQAANVNSFTLNGLNISGNSVKSNNALNCIIQVEGASKFNFCDHTIINNSFNGDLKILLLETYVTERYSLSASDLLVMNLRISDNTNLAENYDQFTYLSLTNSHLAYLNIARVDYSKNHLSGRLFSLETPKSKSKLSDLSRPKELVVTGVTIRDNWHSYNMGFLSLVYLEEGTQNYQAYQPIEIYILNVDNLLIQNNSYTTNSNLSFYETSFFHIDQVQIHLNASVIKDNNFEYCSIISLQRKPSTVMITSSNFTNNVLRYSQIIDSNYMNLGSVSFGPDKKNIETITMLYRYTFIIDSVFSDNKLYSSSLVKSSNPFLIVNNNSFTNTTIESGSLFVKNSLFLGLTFNQSKARSKEELKIPQLAIGYYLVAWTALVDLLSSTSAEGDYLMSFENNNFTDISCINSNFISITNSFNAHSLLRINGNRFVGFTFNQEKVTSLISVENVERMLLTENIFRNLKGNSTIFSSPQNFNLRKTQVHANTASDLEIASFFISSIENVGFIEFSNNTLNNLNITQALVNIRAEKASENFLFKYNNLSNINERLSYSNMQGENFCFICIFITNTLNNSQIQFSDSTYDNIWISSFDDNAKGDFLNVFSSQALQLSKMVIKRVNIVISGNLIQTLKTASIEILNCVISQIRNVNPTGVFNLYGQNITIFGSEFNNIDTGICHGLFYLPVSKTSDFSLSIINDTFNSITSTASTALLSLFNPKSAVRAPHVNFEMINCTLESISSFVSPIMFTDIYCERCIFEDNKMVTALISNPVGLISLAHVSGEFELRKVELFLQYWNLFSIYNSNVEVIVSGLKFNAQLNPFTIASLDSGTLSVLDCVFDQIGADRHAFIEVVPWTKVYATDITAGDPTIFIQNTTFNRIGKSYSIQRFDDYLNHTLFKSGVMTFPRALSLIKIDNTVDLYVMHSQFSNVLNIPVILFENMHKPSSTVFLPSSVKIINSTFYNTRFFYGSVISVFPETNITRFCNIEISDSTFQKAFAGIGGAIAITNASLKITNSTFNGTQAKIVGGAIYAGDDSEIEIDEKTIFIESISRDNRSISHQANNFMVTYNDQSSIESGIESTSEIVDDIQTIILSNVSNHYLNQGFLRLHFINKDFESAFDASPNCEVSLFYITRTYGLTPRNITETTIDFPLRDIVVDMHKKTEILWLLNYTSTRISQTIEIRILFRDCLPGEQTTDKSCLPCPSQTYSIDPSKGCKDCPLDAFCPAQVKICPKKGYWNPSENSSIITLCRSDSINRCSNDPRGICRSCADGYTGPLCEACDFNRFYVESGYLKCGECVNPIRSLIFSCLLGLLYFLYHLFNVYTIYSAANATQSSEDEGGLRNRAQRNLERSFYTKCLLTYTQLMSVLYISSSAIPKHMGVLLQTGNPASLITYGTQCSMFALNLDPTNFIYYQTYFVLISLILQLIGVAILFGIISLFTKKIKIAEFIQVGLLYFVVSYQPGIVTNLGHFLSCKNIDGLEDQYITSHPNWSCKTPAYHFASAFIAIPNLILWSMLIPILIFVVLFIRRHSLEVGTFRNLFSVIILDLKTKYYYWGVLLMLLKILLSFMVYGFENNVEIQIFISLVLLWGYQSLTKSLRPYKTESFNSFEVIMVNLLMFNIVVTKYLLDPKNGPFISTLSLVISLVVNIGFLLHLAWKILSLTFLKVLSLIEDFYKKRKVTSEQDLLEDSHPTNQTL